jgi:predicted nuclease with TOPRIM domain
MVLCFKKKMVTFEEYLKGILKQVDDSHTLLQNLRDKSGDLDIMRRELAKINGLFVALANKLDTNKQELADYQHVLSPIRKYLENHEFFREMDTMSLLYSDDPMRLKNLRMSILDSIKENNLLEHIKSILRE